MNSGTNYLTGAPVTVKLTSNGTKMQKPKNLRDYMCDEIIVYSLNDIIVGDLDTVIKTLQDYKSKYKQYINIKIEQYWHTPDDCGLRLIGDRPLTKEERDKQRLARKATKEKKDKEKAAKRAKELELLKKLAKKYQVSLPDEHYPKFT